MVAAIVPRDPKRDLVAYEQVRTTPKPFQLWVGESPVVTDAGVSAVAALPIYSLAALLADGTIVQFDPATHTAKQAVITAVLIESVGQAVPYWNAGKFNHMAVNWPASALLDTYQERKQYLQGTMLLVGHVNL